MAAAPITTGFLQEGLEWSLAFLCKSLGADDGEVLLPEPAGEELLLSASVGPDRDALWERPRFRMGCGYPGMAYAEQRVIASRSIDRDPRFLRRALTKSGIRTFVSVPIRGAAGKPVGCLDLAWRRDNLDLEPIVEALSLAVHPLANAICAAHPGLPRSIEKPPRLDIKCFGRFEVRIGGETVPPSAFTRRRSLKLLKILVLRAGRPVHRDRLIDLLWPDEQSEGVRLNRLYGVIHALRSAIESEPGPGSGTDRRAYIVSDGESYFFDRGSDSAVDLLRFREWLARADKARRDGESRAAIVRCLAEAIELYRGGLFEDDPYDEWCQAERLELQESFVGVLERLARYHAESGEPERAIECLQRAIKRDPYREGLHADLISLLSRAGRNRDAAGHYQNCLRVFEEELGEKPGHALQSAYRAIDPRQAAL